MVKEFVWEVDNDYSEDGRWGSVEYCTPSNFSYLEVDYSFVSSNFVRWKIDCSIDDYQVSKSGREKTIEEAKQKAIEEYKILANMKLIPNE